MRVFIGLLGLVLCFPAVGCGLGSFVIKVHWTQNVEGRIKRAADSNTVEMAAEELRIAIKYLEENHITEGTTGVVWSTPHEDVGFWYKNLKASEQQLKELPKTASPADRETLLMKLRQTLIDHSDGSEHVTQPSGIAYFPNNAGWLLMSWMFSILCVVGALMMAFCFAD